MRTTACVVGLAVFFVAGKAHAVACDALGGPPVFYIENGDTQEPMIKRLGKQLVDTAGTKVRIVYRNRPTCELADNFYSARTLGATNPARPIRYIPTAAEDAAWDPTKASPQCDMPSSPPIVQLAIGATFLSSCPAPPAPVATIKVVSGPNQAYGFIVHEASSQVAITAEEGYLAFGFTGGGGEASPWLDQNLRFIRGTTASTTLTMASAIGLKAGQLKAFTPFTDSAALMTSVATALDQQATIGILGGDLYDGNRDKVKMLAFKTFGQKYAYYPDSTDVKFDKQNVRDGHYLPWSPTPYLFEVDGGGVPTDATTKRLLELIFGETDEADVDGLKSVVQAGLIPQCAMKVKRDFDGGDLSLFVPVEPCGCFFDKTVPSGATTCTACTDNGPCGTGKCRHGYCEAR